jgi:hypothetical protein
LTFELVFCRGNGANVARIVPYAALHYMAYEEYRRWIILGFPNVQQGPILDLLAGSIAGGTAVICTYPLDLVRTKLSYQVSPNLLTFFIEEEHCIVQSGFKSSSYELKYAKQHIH